MGGGRMSKHNSQTRASSSSSLFNGDAGMLECYCPKICDVRKVNTLKNPTCHLSKDDDDDNCEFFVWVDEAEELGYFKINGIGVGQERNARLMEKVQSMVKAKESGNEEI